MMQTELVTTKEHFDGIKDDWNKLVSECPNMTLFQSYEWNRLYWETFGGELHIVVVRDEKLLGIAPLVLRNGVLEFLGTPKADYTDFIILERHQEVVDAIFSDLGKWKKLYLTEIPSPSQTLKCKFPYPSVIGFANECYAMDFRLEPAGEIERRLKKRDLTRHKKGLKKNGHISIQKSHDEKDLTILFKHHTMIWQAKGMPPIFEQKKQKDFYHKLHKELHGFVMWTLKLNEEVIAIQAGFEFDHGYISYCQAFHPYWSRYSPGNVLHRQIIKEYLKKGYKMVDLSRGAERYKKRFSNISCTSYTISVYKNSISILFAKVYNYVKEWIMKRPNLHNFIYKWKNKLKSWLKSSNP